MASSNKSWWVLQQGTTYFAVESEGPPDLKVPDGQRRKVIRASYPTKEQAETNGKKLAATYHGTWK